MIEEYKLTANDLMQLQYYLENGFILRRSKTSRSKRVMEKHFLDLHEKTAKDFIIFPDGVLGKPVAVENPRFDVLVPSYHIKIKFENEPDMWLTFAPTVYRGGYILRKRFMTYEIEYGSETYQCEDWDQPHFLQVCAHSLRELELKQRTVPGVKFE
jgi:hypothetical protein